MSAHVRRAAAQYAMSRGLSQRRACALTQVARSALYYESRRAKRDAALIEEIKAKAKRKPRWGYRRIHGWLKKQGHQINAKRVHRLWRQEGLNLRRRRRKKRIRGRKHRPMVPTRINEMWAYDFAFDSCGNGQKVKCLVVVDEFSRESLAIEVGASIGSRRVMGGAVGSCFSGSVGRSIYAATTDRSSSPRAVQRWLRSLGTETVYIEPGKPWQNGVAGELYQPLSRRVPRPRALCKHARRSTLHRALAQTSTTKNICTAALDTERQQRSGDAPRADRVADESTGCETRRLRSRAIY